MTRMVSAGICLRDKFEAACRCASRHSGGGSSAEAEVFQRRPELANPAILEVAGIVAALRSYCKQFSTDNGVVVTLDAAGDFENISADVALCLYRVTQEALQNVAKHSGAIEADVRLEVSGEGVALTVSDRGRGFEADAPVTHAGLGLVSMKERARLVNGKLTIASVPGEGATFRVLIPLAAGHSA